MADVYDDATHPEEQSRPGARLGRAVNLAGGLVSLGLIIGTAVWGYKLMVRDVTGVPVVRALEGPVRVTPEDPGGVVAAHQGLAVNQVPADGSAGGPVEQVILAPAPLDLAAEDIPIPLLPRPAPAPEVPAVVDAPRVIDDAPDGALATDMAVAEALGGAPQDLPVEPLDLPEMTGDSTADALALAEALSAGVEPLSGIEADGALRDEQGLRRSPRPAARPGGFAVAAAVTDVTPASAQVEDVAPDTIPEGTRLVQLGAFESADVARAQWDRIGSRFQSYFDGKQRVVQRAEANGKAFYRLRAMGFEDLSDARRFCSALMAEQADCIPVVVR